LPKGETVYLEFDVQKTDRYGRLLAYVWLSDGRMLNEVLVKEGYAMVYTIPPNVKYQERFLQAQRYARENRKGLWGM
ncbi:MAG: thermonuclease, partial [Aquificota bacterium]